MKTYQHVITGDLLRLKSKTDTVCTCEYIDPSKGFKTRKGWNRTAICLFSNLIEVKEQQNKNKKHDL